MSTVQLFFVALGGYLIWFVINHWGDTNVFAPLKNMLQGKGLS